ncbi:MAG: type II toxin-antitoxin system RelE/ParE family toxin [Chelatococcus sp.]|nr:MAG: type II toxin-antitoxin system RelE/ParE family toxin [Chelatococcus sp.]
MAEVDIEGIARFIAADNPRRALSFVEELRARCEALVHHPDSCPLREEYGAGIRMAVQGRYLIFYAASDDGVLIERVIHSARHRPSSDNP